VEVRVQYVTTSDGVNIAYAAFGGGPGVPLVMLNTPMLSHLVSAQEQVWEKEGRETEDLSRHRLVVHYNPRGSGLSDRDVGDQSLDGRVRDLEAVVDRLQLERFALRGHMGSSLVAIAYAARHPDRVSHLILQSGFARGPDYWEQPRQLGLLPLAEHLWDDFTEAFPRATASVFGPWDDTRRTPNGLTVGEMAGRWAAHLRQSMTSRDFVHWAKAEREIDVTTELPRVQAPVLVLVSPRFVLQSLPASATTLLASTLPDARLVSLDGALGSLARATDDFLGDKPAPPVAAPMPPSAASAFRTIVFTDVEGHTEMMQRLGDARGREVLREHERLTREALVAHGGTEVKAMGDGFMASFGSATKALECAVALEKAFEAYSARGGERLLVRVGVNAGEPIAEQGDLFGTAVIMAARIAGQAAGGQVFVSDVVRQLVAGKEFLFSDRGPTSLKGFDEPVRTWELLW
jgi:class 3 adenylate cyclase/pimeloyl-ACP methyl ester carboxylesterase